MFVENQNTMLFNADTKKKGHKTNVNPPNVNLAERDDIIPAIISQVNIAANVKEWIVLQ